MFTLSEKTENMAPFDGDVDDLIKKAGEFGRYQWTILAVLCVMSCFPCAMSSYSMVFNLASPDHWCNVPEMEGLIGDEIEKVKNFSLPWEKRDGAWIHSRCEMYDVNYTEWISSILTGEEFPLPNSSWPPRISCRDGWQYDTTDYDQTFVTRFHLVCDRNWLPAFGLSMFSLSSVIGMMLMGYIADRYGRKLSFLINMTAISTIPAIALLSPNFYIFIFVVFIGVIFSSGVFQTPLVLGLELTTTRKSAFVGFVFCVLFSLAMATLAGLAWLLRDCDKLQLACSLPFLLLLPLFTYVPESPRWLVSQNKLREAEMLLLDIAKKNGKPLEPGFLHKYKEMLEFDDSILEKPRMELYAALPPIELAEEKVEKQASFYELFLWPNLRKKTLLISLIWGFNEVIYTGLSFMSSHIGSSDFISFAISGLVEAPSSVLAWWAMDRYGRRFTIISTMVLVTISCTSTMLVRGDPIMETVLATVGKFGINASYYVIYVYGGELLPTVIRAAGMGFCAAAAGFLSLAGTYILYLAHVMRILPLVVYGLMSFVGAIGCMFLPETIHTRFPETLEEGERFGRKVEVCGCLPHFEPEEDPSPSPKESDQR